jgi:predicted GIY-YIG superfamily endonuclease
VHPEPVEGLADKLFMMYNFYMANFYVYILKCSDGSYYTGHTDNIEKRMSDYHTGNVAGNVATRQPVALVYVEMFATRNEAFLAERRIKGWSKKKKEALVQGNWEEIIRLSNLKANPSTGSGCTV